MLLPLTNTGQTAQVLVFQLPLKQTRRVIRSQGHTLFVYKAWIKCFGCTLKPDLENSACEVHVGLKGTNSKRPFMHSLHTYLLQTYFHYADKIGHSACKARWGRDKMWLRTQKPMNRFPQEEGGRVAARVLIHLGPWREIYELLYSAPMQRNCRIQQRALCAPCRSELNCDVQKLKSPSGGFKVRPNISSTLFDLIDLLYCSFRRRVDGVSHFNGWKIIQQER